MDKDIVISIKTLVIFFLMILGVYVVYKLGPVIAILLICTVLVIALENSVKFFMQKTLFNRPITRSLAVIVTYSILVTVIAAVITLGLPPVVNQAQKLIIGFSQITQAFRLDGMININPTSLLPQFSNISGGLLSVTKAFFSNLTTLFSILIISIYMSLDWENIKRRFLSLFTGALKAEVEETIKEIEQSIGHWIKGQLFLMLVIGSMSYFGLLVLNVDYPLALGLIAGVLEAVPIMGPIVSAILATIIAFADSPIKGLAVLVMFIVIQQLENNLLVPKVMQKVSGFSPLVILLALLVGSNFFGIPGALLAVPITMISVVIVKRVIRYSA